MERSNLSSSGAPPGLSTFAVLTPYPMLTSLRIQNFRSIRDASVPLGQVNLFIGPNNSGKSNFLKGIALLAFSINQYPEKTLTYSDFIDLIPRGLSNKDEEIKINIIAQNDNFLDEAVNLLIGFDSARNSEKEKSLVFTTDIAVSISINSKHKFPGFYFSIKSPNEEGSSLPTEIISLKSTFKGCEIYRLEPSSFNLSAPLSHQINLSPGGKNIANFLYYLGQNYRNRYRLLEADFANCVGSLVSISTPADPDKAGNLKLRFFDQNDIGYWAEEVSEGVLYFLALLCIVHQPDPPKLLLLEEPEKGIHPRRIKEVMDFIFELARLRDIQIILTSHSPYVVDHFADIPECISVFDRENGETVIRNAGDIITETNAKLEKPIRYSDALGEHWVSGFLGGVPL